MVNYKNGKIYRIVCNKTGKQYIGSTTLLLCQRKGNHIEYFKKNRQISSVEIIKNGDFNIILIENYPCETKEQLHSRERYYIETMECINKRIPTRTIKEWKDTNKDRVKEVGKKLYLKKRDEILEKQKELTVCECGVEIRKNNLIRHKNTKKHLNYVNGKTQENLL